MLKKLNDWSSFTLFQKIFIVFFVIGAFLIFISPVILNEGIKGVFSFNNIVGFIIAITGIYVSIYQARAEVRIYYFWIINTIGLVYIYWISNLYGLFMSTLFIMLPIIIYGFYSWSKHTHNKDTDQISIKRFSPFTAGITLAITIILCILYAIFLQHITYIFSLVNIKVAADAQPITDSITTIGTVVGIYLTAKRSMESWYCWIAVDTIGVYIFAIQALNTHYTLEEVIYNLNTLLTYAQYA
ncbi:MAG: nicotinamide riboside transporter PnuC, partial [Psittacicella sp.]